MITRTLAKRKSSRRSFLHALGAGAATLPLLEAGLARGAAGKAPRRVIIVSESNGTISNAFFPAGTSNRLADLTLPAITAPLEPHKKDLIFFKGLEMRNFTDYPNHGAGHENFSCTFTGARGYEIDDQGARFLAGSPTVDQFIAEALIKQQGVSTPVKSLNLGLAIDQRYWHQSRCFYRGSNDPVTPEGSPAKVFSTLFAGSATGSMTDPALERLRAERRSVLDFMARDLTAFAGRLGGEDRRRVEGHLASVREVEKRLTTLQTVSCGSATAPGPIADDADAYPNTLNAFFDMMVLAMKCDVTRVGTVMLSNGNGARVSFKWLGYGGKGMEFGTRESHDLAHRPGPENVDKIAVEKWHMQQFAGLIKRLESVPEGDGTMLDNTVVLWSNHMGNGGAHNSTQLPWVLAGKGGGYLRTGQIVTTTRGPTNGVLKALIAAMGLDGTAFGDPKYGDDFPELRA